MKEGEFWKTEEYFEKAVWRNYVKQHADLFEGGNVEGSSIDREACCERGIAVQEGMNVEVGQTVSWAVDVVIGLVEDRIRDSRWDRAHALMCSGIRFR